MGGPTGRAGRSKGLEVARGSVRTWWTITISVLMALMVIAIGVVWGAPTTATQLVAAPAVVAARRLGHWVESDRLRPDRARAADVLLPPVPQRRRASDPFRAFAHIFDVTWVRLVKSAYWVLRSCVRARTSPRVKVPSSDLDASCCAALKNLVTGGHICF